MLLQTFANCHTKDHGVVTPYPIDHTLWHTAGRHFDQYPAVKSRRILPLRSLCQYGIWKLTTSEYDRHRRIHSRRQQARWLPNGPHHQQCLGCVILDDDGIWSIPPVSCKGSLQAESQAQVQRRRNYQEEDEMGLRDGAPR